MGRLRKKPWAEEYLKKSNNVVNNPELYKNTWKNGVFKNENPIWIEIGIGKGQFIIQQAMKNENVNFIGIEKYPSIQVIPIKKTLERKINNLKFINGDVKNINDWFDNKIIDKIFINFPDPWPKKKHEKRRLLFNTFLNSYYLILKNDSFIEFKTDQIDLFNFAIEQIKMENKFLIKNAVYDLHKNANFNTIRTEYETKFIEKNKKIYYAEFHKNQNKII